MARLTTLLTAAALATTLSSPVFACSWGKTAKHGKDMTAEAEAPKVTEEAMTTFDPAEKPVFESTTEVKDEKPAVEVTAD